MNTRFNIKLGLEEIENESKEVEVLPIEEISESPDSFSLSDISSDIHEVDSDTQDVSDAIDAVVTLESIALELNSSLSVGGLTPLSLKITKLSLESLFKSLGTKSISLESFNDSSDNIAQTKVAVESIMGKIVSIIKAIINSVKRGIEWIQKFIRHIFNKFEALKDKIKSIRLALVKTTKDEASDKLFKSKSVIRFLKSDDKFDLVNELTHLTSFAKEYFSHINPEAKKLVDNINEIVKLIPDKDITPVLDKRLFLTMPGGMREGLIAGKSLKSDTIGGYISKDTFPNNVKIFMSLPTTVYDNKSWDEAAKQCEFIVHSDNKEDAEITDVPVLDKKEIVIVLQHLEALCNESINSKKEYNEFINNKNSVVKDLEHAMTKYSSSKSEADAGGYISPVLSRMKLLDNVYVNGTAHFSNYITKVLSSGITYSEFCVKAYA